MSGLPILTYHALDDSGSVLATPPAHFLATMRLLHAEGFRCVDLREWVERGRPSIDRGFALAFDDGLASIRGAAESLHRFGFMATAFLVTGRTGGLSDWSGGTAGLPVSPIVRWCDLADLRASGFRFGAHTVTHPRLNRLRGDGAAMEAEILASRSEIEQRTGEACRLFAYPYGEAPPRARALVAREFAAGFGTRLDAATAGEDRACLSRIDAFYLRSDRALRAFVAGRWGMSLRMRRAARAVRRWGQRVGAPMP